MNGVKKRVAIVHYNEIGLKKSNKGYFVDKLLRAIKLRLEKRFKQSFRMQHTLSRIVIELPEEFGVGEFEEQNFVTVLGRIFGIANFKFAYLAPVDPKKIDEFYELVFQNIPKFPEHERPLTFRTSVKRSMLMDGLGSIEMERNLGAHVLRSGIDMKVSLKRFEFLIDVEFFNENGYFSFNKYAGMGGLSGNTQGKLISTISSGIDSPVASFKMMKRGARIIFVHFHGYPYTDLDEMEQVKDIVEILSGYQFDTKLYLVPFGQVQKAIAVCPEIPEKIRTVLYRRFMLRIAQMVAKKERAKGVVTGDSYGQVASQTAENMFVIDEACTIPVYRPLVGDDKEDIITVSKKIGTFEISKLPCKDSCSVFMPASPELRANLFDVRRYEEFLDVEMWCQKVLDEAEVEFRV